jgi:hypothetical protein
LSKSTEPEPVFKSCWWIITKTSSVIKTVGLQLLGIHRSPGRKLVQFQGWLAPEFTKMQTLMHGAITSYVRLAILECDGHKLALS